MRLGLYVHAGTLCCMGLGMSLSLTSLISRPFIPAFVPCSMGVAAGGGGESQNTRLTTHHVGPGEPEKFVDVPHLEVQALQCHHHDGS